MRRCEEKLPGRGRDVCSVEREGHEDRSTGRMELRRRPSCVRRRRGEGVRSWGLGEEERRWKGFQL